MEHPDWYSILIFSIFYPSFPFRIEPKPCFVISDNEDTDQYKLTHCQ